jgi:hypothetical protein
MKSDLGRRRIFYGGFYIFISANIKEGGKIWAAKIFDMNKKFKKKFFNPSRDVVKKLSVDWINFKNQR